MQVIPSVTSGTYSPGPIMAHLLTQGASGGELSKPQANISSPLMRQCREITDFADFTGRLDAETVEVRARVGGWVDRVLFKAGTEVKAGDLLFDLDSRTYQGELDRAT